MIKQVFQHTAARRRLRFIYADCCRNARFQHTAARRRLHLLISYKHHLSSFNTQPRGGGCIVYKLAQILLFVFQHTAARRRLQRRKTKKAQDILVSTHSRAEAAADILKWASKWEYVSTHSRAEAAAFINMLQMAKYFCFNTQPRGGGCAL